jgi:hypothetical protein
VKQEPFCDSFDGTHYCSLRASHMSHKIRNPELCVFKRKAEPKHVLAVTKPRSPKQMRVRKR